MPFVIDLAIKFFPFFLAFIKYFGVLLFIILDSSCTLKIFIMFSISIYRDVTGIQLFIPFDNFFNQNK